MTPQATISIFLLTLASFMMLRPFAKSVGLVDLPGGRKSHSQATPMVGGLGIYLGLLAIYIMSPVLVVNYQSLLLLSGLILAFGIIDDAVGLTAASRLVAHGCIALAMAWFAGITLESFGNILFIGPVFLGVFAIPLTIFATLGVINAVNMSDGLDGLSGGLVVIALTALSLCAMMAGSGAVLNFSVVIIIQLLAFLLLNFRSMWNKSPLLFLGDSGSTLLGFLLAWLLIESTQGSNPVVAPVYALWFFALPLMDTVSLLIRRPLSGRSPFSPGLDHFHHRLLQTGFSKKKTVLVMYGLAAVIAVIGVVAHLLGVSEGVMFWGFISLFVVFLAATKKHSLLAETEIERS